MGVLERLNFGIVGAGGRGGRFKPALELVEGIRVHAVCDTDPAALATAAELLGAPEQYLDHHEMLARSDLDVVIVGTPMPYHVQQAVAALERDIHVLSEVPAGVSVQECRLLAQAAKASSALYAMGENFAFTRQNQIVRQMVLEGLFGTTYYAEGEYIHELKDLNERTRWRRRWQTGINGVTYGTHSLGPVLQWMPGDRVASVCCAGSGHHYEDPRGDRYENEDSCVMLCRMESGGLVKVRVDMLSDRPHSMAYFQLQGTDGCYESARASGEMDRIWLRSRGNGSRDWMDLEELAAKFTPDLWRTYEGAASRTGHWGGDLIVVADLVAAIRNGTPPSIGVHEALDMTLPGLASQQSIAEGGRWVDVPDSREW